MYLPVYLFCGLYLIKAGWTGEIGAQTRVQKVLYQCVGVGATVYCLWTFYAGDMVLLLHTSLVYLVGIPFYFRARSEQCAKDEPYFTRGEKLVLIAVMIASLFSVSLIAAG